jgi:hypothetical protein
MGAVAADHARRLQPSDPLGDRRRAQPDLSPELAELDPAVGLEEVEDLPVHSVEGHRCFVGGRSRMPWFFRRGGPNSHVSPFRSCSYARRIMAMEKARDVLVIGGSRYFGKRLIARLLAAGDRVTVLNRGSSAPPAGVVHLIADRDDEDALRAALGPRTFDVVVDQVCYTPRQAAIARRVFTGRTGRYVMTSTVEVYEYEDSPALVSEAAVDPLT